MLEFKTDKDGVHHLVGWGDSPPSSGPDPSALPSVGPAIAGTSLQAPIAPPHEPDMGRTGNPVNWCPRCRMDADRIERACEVMHDAYEKAAGGAGWETNPESRVPWKDVPDANKRTMRAAVGALLEHLNPQ